MGKVDMQAYSTTKIIYIYLYVYIYIYKFRFYPTLNRRFPLQISMLYIETIDIWTKNHATQVRAACGQNV